MKKNIIYIKDSEGYVREISPEKMKPEYTQITREEWETESGVKYYKTVINKSNTTDKTDNN